MSETNGNIEDLRSYLEFVKGKGRNAYIEVEKPIAARWETTAVVTELERKMRTPVLHFKAIADCDFTMVTNVCSSFERVANGSDMSGEDLSSRFGAVMSRQISPSIVASREAPVRENIRSFEQFSLASLPQLYYTQSQTSPYLTAAIIIARDPDSGAHNASFHRLMLIANDSATIFMTQGGHLDRIWKKNCQRNKPTPLSAVIGTHPLWCYASLVSGDLDHDDYQVMSAVLGGPIQLTPGIDDPELLIPARGEIVLEGMIDQAARHEEGPFGEFLGYVAERSPKPVVRFTTASFRNGAIFQDIIAGHSEHLMMSSVTLRARLGRDYLNSQPAIKDYWLPAAMTLFLAVDRSKSQQFDPVELMQEMLKQERYLKQIICFDSDVDLRKQGSVQNALSCHVQPDRDIVIIGDCCGNGIDPSEQGGMTSKMAVDARMKTETVRNALPSEVLENFDLAQWLG